MAKSKFGKEIKLQKQKMNEHHLFPCLKWSQKRQCEKCRKIEQDRLWQESFFKQEEEREQKSLDAFEYYSKREKTRGD